MRLRDTTSKSLLLLTFFILLFSLMIGSPAGRFFSAIASGAMVLIPLFSANAKLRVFAGVLLGLSAFSALNVYSEYQQDLGKYRAKPPPETNPPAQPDQTQTGSEPPGSDGFYLYRLDNYFTCGIPADWTKEELLSGTMPDQEQIYGIILHGPWFGPAPFRISVLFYAAGNHLYSSPEHYIRAFTQPSLGVALKGDQYGPATAETVFARAAQTFERIKTEFLANPQLKLPDDHDGKVYERREMMAAPFQIREKFVVVPAEEGFYALCYSAPADRFMEFLSLFAQVKQSFHPSK